MSLYSSAMWDENSVYPRIETGCAFALDMNKKLDKKFTTGSFTPGSAILKFKFYNPKNVIVQHFPIKERKEKLKLIVCEMVISLIL